MLSNAFLKHIYGHLMVFFQKVFFHLFVADLGETSDELKLFLLCKLN